MPGSREMLRNYKGLRFGRRFLYIAYGSVCELETQIMLSGDLSYLNGNQLSKLQKEVGEVERMLQALIKSLENKPLKP